MDAQKALVWRGNNFGVVTTPYYLHRLESLVTYFLPVSTPRTPRTKPLDVFAIPTARQYGILPKKYMLWLVALSCIVLRHRLPLHWQVSLCVLPVVADLWHVASS
jgi:hypothetical protein